MRNLYLFISFLLLSQLCEAQKKRITNVITHNASTVICDASKGVKEYPAWGSFPSSNESLRKITMHVTLGSPDSISTAHWDYLDHIILRRKGGKNGVLLNYELGRMLTPYGSVFGKGWKWDWQVDVTDFSHFLRDSVEVVYIHSGYEAPSVGWKLTVNFEILQGPEVVKQLSHSALWNGAFKYGNAKLPFESQVKPFQFTAVPNADFSRIRIQHTGHGMDKPRGCSEFCSRWRKISLDGVLIDVRDMWKDCGNNPLYPQGGTWVYDRAYWCPGDLQRPDIIESKLKSGSHEVSLQMEPYQATENIQAEENISAFLFQYSAPLSKHDVAVERVMVPSDENEFTRLNPASINPRIIIRNLGSEPIKQLLITYWTEGFKKKTFKWKGYLQFNSTAVVDIPGKIDMGKGDNKFNVILGNPDGKKDAFAPDNYLTSTFKAPASMPLNFVIEMLTNNRPSDNTLTLVNEKGDSVLIHRPRDLKANTLYRDTLHLKQGLYELCLTDTAGDGLEFWAEPDRGFGHLRLFDMEGRLIHVVESDCGNGEMFAFEASEHFKTDTIKSLSAFSLFPRLTSRNTNLNIVSNRKDDYEVKIRVDDKVYEQHKYFNIMNGSYDYDLSAFPDGRIIMEVWQNGQSKFRARLHKAKNPHL